MADESTQSITIDADPGAIMAVIADFPNYPVWAESVKDAEVLETGPDGRARRVAFDLDAGIIRDHYELIYVWSGDEQVEWDLTSGQMMRAQHGSYTLQPTGPGPHRRDLLAGGRPHHSDARACSSARRERVVMDTALKELKKRVEGLPA